jgi:hypothetical protein
MIMKKILLLILLGSQLNIVLAQEIEFPTEFAVWRYSFMEEATVPFMPEYFYMEGDSTYNNTPYKLVSDAGLIRSENKKVYFIPEGDTVEYLIYDFTLEIGDKFLPPSYSNNSISDSITVTQINSTTIYGNILRKIWRFDYSDTDWIEGIGATVGFITDPWYEIPINGYSFLECFTKDSVTIQGECSLSSSYNKSLKKIRVSIFPNPFHDRITIKTDLSQTIDLIQVFDVNGQLINSVESQVTIQMDSELPNGVYFLRVAIDGQEFYRRVVK